MGQIKNIKLHIVTDIKAKSVTMSILLCLRRLNAPFHHTYRGVTSLTPTFALRPLHTTCPKNDDSLVDSKGYPTTLRGGCYMKEGDDPILKHPSEYPDWLWTIDEQNPYNLQDVTVKEHGQKYYDKRWKKYRMSIRNPRLRIWPKKWDKLKLKDFDGEPAGYK